MSIELGGKNITYLNLSQTGRESDNNGPTDQTCSVKLDFRDSPLLDKQDDYICAVTRFSIPLSEIPTINQCSFTIYKYNSNTMYNQHGHLAPAGGLADFQKEWCVQHNIGIHEP